MLGELSCELGDLGVGVVTGQFEELSVRLGVQELQHTRSLYSHARVGILQAAIVPLVGGHPAVLGQRRDRRAAHAFIGRLAVRFDQVGIVRLALQHGPKRRNLHFGRFVREEHRAPIEQIVRTELGQQLQASSATSGTVAFQVFDGLIFQRIGSRQRHLSGQVNLLDLTVTRQTIQIDFDAVEVFTQPLSRHRYQLGRLDGLVAGGPREGYACDGTELLTGRNNIFLGDADYFDPEDLTFLFYQEGCPGLTFDSDYSIYHSVKLSLYVPNSHDIAADPLLAGPITGTAYGMALTAGSPAIDSGDNTYCPSTDIRGVARPVDGDGIGAAVCDMGAYEWREPAAWIYLPIMITGP